MPPTPDDLARDAAVDMAVCDAATAGPWICDVRIGCLAVYAGEPHNCLFESADYIHYVRGDNTPTARSPYGGWCMDPQKVADGQLFAMARTALPAWIRRATAAEAENRTLCARVVELGNVWPEQVQRLEAERDAARAQVARLREAVERYVAKCRLCYGKGSTVGPYSGKANPCPACAALRAALAATGDGREEGT